MRLANTFQLLQEVAHIAVGEVEPQVPDLFLDVRLSVLPHDGLNAAGLSEHSGGFVRGGIGSLGPNLLLEVHAHVLAEHVAQIEHGPLPSYVDVKHHYCDNVVRCSPHIIGGIAMFTNQAQSGMTSLWISFDDIISALIVVAVIIASIFLVRHFHQKRLRDSFSQALGVRVPRTMKVHKARTVRQGPASLTLRYPEWTASKSDGTHDARRNDMSTTYHPSVMFVDSWRLTGNNPFDAYKLARNLRDAGCPVAMCPEEEEKRAELTRRAAARESATSVSGIVSRFAGTPTDFEGFCADLYRALGWKAETTQAVNDGGLDIRMTNPEGVSYIAECKCFDPSHHVGRPVIQKLHGANAIEQAQGMMVITTSTFTKGAMDYAAEVGVDLVDGPRLVKLCNQAWGGGKKVTVPESEWRLTRQDILQHIPTDMWNRY